MPAEIEARLTEWKAMTQALVDKPQTLTTGALKVGAYWAIRDLLDLVAEQQLHAEQLHVDLLHWKNEALVQEAEVARLTADRNDWRSRATLAASRNLEAEQ